MINVRLKQSEVARLDAAAQKTGASRSDFIRKAIERELARVGDKGGSVTGVKVRGKAKSSKFPYDDCPKGPQCQFVRAATGIQVCTTCGHKKA